MREPIGFLAFLVMLVGAALLVILAWNIHQDDQINKLQREVACLQHPTSGASSTAVKRVNGHWVTVRPAYRTVC